MERRTEKVQNCGMAVMFLIVCGNEVLLEDRTDSEHGFPNERIILSGKNESGENYEAAALREIREETKLEGKELIPLGGKFKAITTNAHLYETRAFMVIVEDKSEVENVDPLSGKHVWVEINEAIETLPWSHSQLVLERAKRLLGEN